MIHLLVHFWRIGIELKTCANRKGATLFARTILVYIDRVCLLDVPSPLHLPTGPLDKAPPVTDSDASLASTPPPSHSHHAHKSQRSLPQTPPPKSASARARKLRSLGFQASSSPSPMALLSDDGDFYARAGITWLLSAVIAVQTPLPLEDALLHRAGLRHAARPGGAQAPGLPREHP